MRINMHIIDSDFGLRTRYSYCLKLDSVIFPVPCEEQGHYFHSHITHKSSVNDGGNLSALVTINPYTGGNLSCAIF